MKQPTSHFSLTDLRKSIDEHPSPLFTLTKSEMEAMVSRLESAAEFFEYDVTENGYHDGREEWLASLEMEG